MYLTQEEKGNLFAEHGKDKNDTGSAEGQIALFTHRISHMSDHLKNNRKDYATAFSSTFGRSSSFFIRLPNEERYCTIQRDCKEIKFT